MSARDNLRGVYRYLVRVLSVSLVVQDYPRLPGRFRECMCGYVAGTLELVGAKHVAVAKNDDDPNAWEFRIKWALE